MANLVVKVTNVHDLNKLDKRRKLKWTKGTFFIDHLRISGKLKVTLFVASSIRKEDE